MFKKIGGEKMKNVEMGALKVLKSVLDKGMDDRKEANSHCFGLLYQPKRKVSKRKR